VAGSLRVVLAFVVAVLGAAPAVAAGPVEECIDAFEKAQIERDGGRLTRARHLLTLCSQDSCPAEIRQECREWRFELEPRIPTLVLRARVADGPDLVDVRVYVDGALLVEKLDGRAVRVDPGVRQLRWEYPGHAPVQTEVIVREGEKNRFVSATFVPAVADQSLPADRPARQAQVPLGAWIAGGVGVAGLATFAVLGLNVEARERQLREDCAPRCTSDEVHALERQALLANIALGVGVAGIAVGTWLVLSSESGSSSTQTALYSRSSKGAASALGRPRF
jgi:hypothetical protein